MTAKRVKAISATKKRDAMPSGIRTTGDWPQGQAVRYQNATLNMENWMFLHSPSYIPFRNAKSPYGRNSSRIHHTSFAEKLEVDIPFPVPVEHRRIVFSNMYEDQRAVCALPGEDSTTFESLRNLTNVPIAAFTDLFQGTKDRDWWFYTRAPLDKKKVTVHYDKMTVYTPRNQLGQTYNRKFYHKINKVLDYPDVEHGNDQITEGNWPGIKSPKMFIMDIFRSTRDTRLPEVSPLGEQYMAISSQATNYWTEPS